MEVGFWVFGDTDPLVSKLKRRAWFTLDAESSARSVHLLRVQSLYDFAKQSGKHNKSSHIGALASWSEAARLESAWSSKHLGTSLG